MGTASRAAAALVLTFGMAQAPERAIGETKTEAQARAERGNYPLIGLDPADARDASDTIHTRDLDEWQANDLGRGAIRKGIAPAPGRPGDPAHQADA